MDFTIVYDKDHRLISDNGLSAYSEVFYVPPGKAALLSLYNLVNTVKLVTDPKTGKSHLSADDCAVVHKMSLGRTGDFARHVACGERVDIAAEARKLLLDRRIFYEPVYQDGCPWSLNPCNNYALISVPGFYMLEFYDTEQFDNAYVEYALLSVADSLAIPDGFKLGSGK